MEPSGITVIVVLLVASRRPQSGTMGIKAKVGGSDLGWRKPVLHARRLLSPRPVAWHSALQVPCPTSRTDATLLRGPSSDFRLQSRSSQRHSKQEQYVHEYVQHGGL